ncbi:MAG: hypothetical protein WCI72_06145 [archaeon]
MSMNLFKKKATSDEIPQIPSIPELPSFNLNAPKPTTDLPAIQGDARDINNQEAIKSAIDSSEKIGGDSGGASSPSESFSIPPISSSPINNLPPRQLSQSPIPEAPIPLVRPLPELSRYEPRQQGFSNSPTLPPLNVPPQQASFIRPEQPIVQESSFNTEEKTVKRDASDSIFVRIDKFNSAKHDVDEIGRDLKQITQVIEKITDIKLKEDEEITEINKTLEEIKNRINRIDLEVFNRI